MWDEITAGGKKTDLQLSITGMGDEVTIFDQSRCYADTTPPRTLVVPLVASLSMAKGEVQADGVLTVAAHGAESLDLVEFAPDWGLPATLTGQYEADLMEHIASGPFPDQVLDGVYVVGDESWTAAEIDIEIQTHRDDAGSAEAVWRGHWQL